MTTPDNQTPALVRSYAVRLRGETIETIRAATSPGRAKAQAFPDIKDCCPDTIYTDLRVRALPSLVESEQFRSCMHYRGIPFARIGMRVEVGGKPGVIVGHNSSANLDVEFANGLTLNCHPHSEIRYFDDAGNVIADHRRTA